MNTPMGCCQLRHTEPESSTKQTTFRIPSDLLGRFKAKAATNGEKMNRAVVEMIERYVVGENKTAWCAPSSSVSSRLGYLHRAFVVWLPIVFLIKELGEGRVLFANPEFLTLVGKTDVFGYLPTDYWKKTTANAMMAHDRVVREKGVSVICEEEVPVGDQTGHRLTIRFPVKKAGRMVSTGALGLNAEQLRSYLAALVPDTNGQRFRPLAKVEFASGLGIGTADSLLAEVLHAMPATVAIKDLQGRILYTNREFTRVTGKKPEDVLNKTTTQNWPGPEGMLIFMHDELVRVSKAPYLSIETITVANPAKERLNLRFPIFNSAGELEFTGTLGLSSDAVHKSLELLKSGSTIVEFSDNPVSIQDQSQMATTS